MKIAIIGYGGMGYYHQMKMDEFNQTNPAEKLELAGIYDISEKSNNWAKEQGITAFNSPEEIWQDKSIEAILIATPNDVHKHYVLEGAKHGKNIICEKPIGLTSKEAIEMYDATEKAGVLFEVHQNRRWDNDYLTIKNIYDNALIGDVYKIESRVMGGNGIPGAWRKVKAQGGGMMPDWGVHLIDQMLQMVKSPVESVYCSYSYVYGEEVEDGFNLITKFTNGVEYRIEVTTDCFRNLPRWQVYGTKGTATVDDWSISGGITKANVDSNAMPTGINAGNGFTRTMAPRLDESVINEELEIIKAQPFAYYKNFISACRKAEEPKIKREEVVRVFKLMELAELSAKKNKVIKKNI